MDLEPAAGIGVVGIGDNLEIVGRQQDVKLTQAQLKLVAAAEAAGTLTVKASREERAELAKHVQSDTDALKAQRDAMASGDWHRDNLETVATQAELLLKFGVYDLAGELVPLTADARAIQTTRAYSSRNILKHLDATDGDYEAAVLAHLADERARAAKEARG